MDYIITREIKKSYTLLFPLVGIAQGAEFVPYNTYCFWNEKCCGIDCLELIAYYKHNYEERFKRFEQKSLMENKRFKRIYEEDSGSVYIFDLEDYHETIDHFMKGRYSKIDDNVKKAIREYYKDSPFTTVEREKGDELKIILYPNRYISLVNKEFEVNPGQITELMSKPSIEEETLILNDFMHE